MTKDSQDELARAYATLTSLRKNIDKIGMVPEKYARDYHNILDRLNSVGIEVDEFRVPEVEIKPVVRSFNMNTHIASYSSDKYVERAFMLTKVDAILGYFEIITSDKPRKIGFKHES